MTQPDTALAVVTSGSRPEPVMDAVKLGGLVAAAVTATIGAVGTITAGVTLDNAAPAGIAVGAAVTALATLIVYVAQVIVGRQARAQVTPLVAPLSADGVPLVTDLPGQHAADRAG